MTHPIDTEEVHSEPEPEGSPMWASWVAALLVTAVGAVLLVGAWDIPERAGQPLGPRAFPLAVGVVALGVGLTLIGQLWLRRKVMRRGDDLAVGRSTSKRWVSLALLVGVAVAYALLLAPVGYVVSTVAFFIAVCFLLGSRSPLRDFAIGASIALVIYFSFNGLLGVRLPGGILDFGI